MVVVQDSTFKGLTSETGGSIFLRDSLQGFMSNNTFTENQARQGGAIYVENSQLELADN